MDKDWKLRQYRRKDYSDLVDFPVEIVGRDGVVRRYVYEDAIRLYHRRMGLAGARYRDSELVNAEVGHCRGRIRQLRHSFFYAFGWGTEVQQADPRELLGELAGEVAALLVRTLHWRRRLDLVVTLVETPEEPVVFYVQDPRVDQGLLLYLFRFAEPAAADPICQRFFGALKALMGADRAGETEQVIAFHQSSDCGLILTGPPGARDQVEALRAMADSEPGDATPWDLAMASLRRAEHAEALEVLWEIVHDQAFHRRGYLAGALVGLALDRQADAELMALMGRRVFPRDPSLALVEGLALRRRGAASEALTALDDAAALGVADRTVAPFALSAASYTYNPIRWILAMRRWLPVVLADPAGPVFVHARRALGFWAVAWLAFIVGVVNAVQVWPLGLVPLVVIGGLVAMGRVVISERAMHLMCRVEDQEVAQRLREVQRKPEQPIS